jgi:hypothetical protein
VIKLDRPGWARKLLKRAVRTRRAESRRQTRVAATESLEDRCLLTPLIADDSVDLNENTPNFDPVYDVNDVNTDADFDEDLDALTYSFLSGNELGAFVINAGTGEITVDNFLQLDFETTPVFSLEVQADDGLETPSVAIITVNLINLNEDIRLDDAFLIDGNGTPILSPFVGEMIGVQVNYTTDNLPDPIDYRIGYRIDGVPLDTEGLENGEGEHTTPPQQWVDIVEGWYATGGTHTVEVILDADNTVTEDDETNNTLTFTFNAATASPPVQFGWPVDGDPQTDHYITAYVDLDPTTDDNTRDDESDYTGGFHTVDETTGWHISPPTFSDQDAKIPVYAAADGVVSEVHDGEFDRRFEVLNPLPDPIPESNFITIDHGDGYTTTYSRLRQNSVWLRPGDPVVQGQLIGLIGSSGPFSVEPALHWEVARHGRPIETLLDPAIYLENAPDYSGSFSTIRRSFFTQCLPTHPFQPCPNPTTFEESNPYGFVGHILEGPSSVDYFTVTGNQPVTVFAEFGTIRTGDTIEAVWSRPDGTEYARDMAVADREDYSGEFWWRQFMPAEPIQGEWTVEFFQNGGKVGEDSFSIQFEEFPDIRVERQTLFFPARLDFPEDILVDERYTPLDLDEPGGGELGADQDETFTVHNQGTQPLIVDQILVPDAFEFDVYDNGGTVLTNFPGAASYAGGFGTLETQPGSATYIRVGPQPGLAPGYYSGMIRIFTNDPEEQDYNISIESRVPTASTLPALEIGISARDIFEDPVSGDLRTRLVGSVRRVNDTALSIEEEVVVDLVAEVSDVTFPGNIRLAPGEDYASFYIETFNDNKIEGLEYLRIGARDRDTVNPYTPAFTTLRIVDDDFAGLNIVETDGGTVVDENTSTDTFGVTLTAEPITNVVIDVSTSDIGEATASPAQLTFTPLNWNTAQTVTVTGVNDDATDGDILSNVVLSIDDFRSDNDFDALADVLVPVTTIDNDIPGFLITESDGASIVDESGTTDSVAVRLTRAPLANVLLDISVADLEEVTANLASIVFTPTNWDIDQFVTLTGIDDVIVDGDISSSVSFTVRDSASDPDWALVEDQSIAVTTTDDEVAGFTVLDGGATLIVSETGTTATFGVVLTDIPQSDVILQLEASDTTEAVVSPATLRFRPGNALTPQLVTVTGIDDAFVDLDADSVIRVSVVEQGTNNFFDGVGFQDVMVTTIDDDAAGVSVIESDGDTVVTESGSINDFVDIVLSAEPESDVVLDVASSDTSEFTVSTSSVTFTPTNWNVPVRVDVLGVGDTEVDGDITAAMLIAVNDALSDPSYHSIVVDPPIMVTNIDDEVAEIVVLESGGSTTVSETGSSDEFDVTLTGQPLAPVVVSVLLTDDTEVSVSTTALTFTAANYNIPQRVTVTGADDGFVDGTITSRIVLSVKTDESHSAYHPAADQLITVTTSDDDVAGITILESAGSTIVDESGATDDIDVVLGGEPQNDVVLVVSHSDSSEAVVSQSRLTFTPSNWDTAQSVTVTGVDDLLADGDITANITVSVDDSASDSLYRSVTDVSVDVTTQDDDTAGFVVVESGSHTLTREGGNTDDVDVMLTAAPTTPVTIDVESRDSSEVGVAPASVTFDASNWNIPQTITFNAVDDFAEDGKRTTFVDFTVDASSNSMFLGRSDVLSVITVDNDSAIYIDDIDLVIDATIEDDTITLDEFGSTINVTLNGATVPFDTADYEQIFILAKPGDDVITASSVTKPLRILGAGGDDLIFGGSANDTIRGGGGKDTIFGGAGADSIGGGNKRDSLSGGLGLDSLSGGRGADEIDGGDGSDSIKGENGRDTIIGGNGHDTIAGNNGPDSIHGDNGNDYITGGGGDDIVFAGSGEDVILGGSGKDEIHGEGDSDLAVGGSGNDTILGYEGRDVLFGGTDVDIVTGNEGDDILVAGRSNLSVEHLISIVSEWNSTRSYLERVDNIHDGPSATPDKLNTAFLIGPNRPASPQTAFDDGRRDELTGDDGNDFFFANVGMGDILNDNTIDEWVDLI